MKAVRYHPGGGTLFAADHVALWVNDETENDLTQRIWKIINTDSSSAVAEDLIEALTGFYGLRTLPAFALLEHIDGAVVVTLRGTVAAVELAAEEPTLRLTAAPRGPWTVHDVSDFLRIAVGPISKSDLPLSTGVARAAGLSYGHEVTDEVVPEPAPDLETAPIVIALAAQPEPKPDAEESPSEVLLPSPGPADEVSPTASRSSEQTGRRTLDADAEDDESGFTTLFQRHRSAKTSAAPPDSDSRSTSDSAAKSTPAIPAVAEPSKPDVPVQPVTAQVGSATQTWNDRGAIDLAPKVLPEPKSGLIDGIPGFAEPTPSSTPPLSPAAPDAVEGAFSSAEPQGQLPPEFEPGHDESADDDGLTIPRPAGVMSRRTTPEVLAARCPKGHLNPAHAATCRVCSAAVPAQEPQWMTRPSLGRMLLPKGEAIDVDRGIVFGRAPHEPSSSHERPHLINISSYGPHLSRMHLEVVLDGWFVMARDLGSTSGTVLTLPGREPERLRTNELITLQPGALLDLAGDYLVTYEVSS